MCHRVRRRFCAPGSVGRLGHLLRPAADGRAGPAAVQAGPARDGGARSARSRRRASWPSGRRSEARARDRGVRAEDRARRAPRSTGRWTRCAAPPLAERAEILARTRAEAEAEIAAASAKLAGGGRRRAPQARGGRRGARRRRRRTHPGPQGILSPAFPDACCDSPPMRSDCRHSQPRPRRRRGVAPAAWRIVAAVGVRPRSCAGRAVAARATPAARDRRRTRAATHAEARSTARAACCGPIAQARQLRHPGRRARLLPEDARLPRIWRRAATQIRQDLVTAAEMRETATAQLAEIERKLQALPAELEALKARGAEDVARRAGAHRAGRGGRARAAARADAARDRHAAAHRAPRADRARRASSPSTVAEERIKRIDHAGRSAAPRRSLRGAVEGGAMTSRAAGTRYARALFDVALKEGGHPAGRAASSPRSRSSSPGNDALARVLSNPAIPGGPQARASSNSCSRRPAPISPVVVKLLAAPGRARSARAAAGPRRAPTASG